MSDLLNPGTEAVAAATIENACEAVRLFILDLGVAPVFIKRTPDFDDLGSGIGGGRFAFLLSTKKGECEIDMPGCDPAITRKGKSFESPRLYVDGSSWLWGFAISIALRSLTGEEE